MTIRRRSFMLHGPAAGILLVQAFVAGFYAIAVAAGLAGAMYASQVILIDDYQLRRPMLVIGWPVAGWLTAAFMTVVRFLNYLDTRIRHEGWEVELRLRAEGKRITEAWR